MKLFERSATATQKEFEKNLKKVLDKFDKMC